ncbi:MAG: hypothetical protein ABIQ72_10530 [Usitatibacter sp.]
MTRKYRLAAAAFALLGSPAFAQTSAAQATATFDRIRTTPAELQMHCEQLRAQGDAISARMKGDKAGVAAKGERVKELQARLPGYKDAVNFVADKAGSGGIEYFKSPEGKAVDTAQKALMNACTSKAPRK